MTKTRHEWLQGIGYLQTVFQLLMHLDIFCPEAQPSPPEPPFFLAGGATSFRIAPRGGPQRSDELDAVLLGLRHFDGGLHLFDGGAEGAGGAEAGGGLEPVAEEFALRGLFCGGSEGGLGEGGIVVLRGEHERADCGRG